jgi:hypothetical protein
MGRPYIINSDSVRGVHLTFAPLGMQLLHILSIRTIVPATVLDLGRSLQENRVAECRDLSMTRRVMR